MGAESERSPRLALERWRQVRGYCGPASAKLAIGESDDELEEQADRITLEVSRVPKACGGAPSPAVTDSCRVTSGDVDIERRFP